eukprot:Hpha_TRINITY_DN3695_c0_g1::TRINITY_DN3695_c0_g1_i2::g.1134::m.1134
MSINVDAPLFLTQALLPQLEAGGGGRVLHVSSGAAQNAYPGWGAYCTSKAALNMMYRMLAKELSPRGVHVGSARPGVVATPMQEVVRSASAEAFPALPMFIEMHEKGQLLPPEDVGMFLEWLLVGTTPEEFQADEWDIRGVDRSRWAADSA